MKRSLGFLLLMVLSFSLIACGTGEKDASDDKSSGSDINPYEEVAKEVQEGDFILKLVSKKSNYLPHEEVEVYAMLKYVGDQKEVAISHGASPFWFTVTEHSRDITIEPAQTLPLIYTTLKKDEWYEEQFTKSGGHSNDDFLQSYFSEEGFPTGEYTINLRADFAIEDKEAFQLSTSIDFTVKEN